MSTGLSQAYLSTTATSVNPDSLTQAQLLAGVSGWAVCFANMSSATANTGAGAMGYNSGNIYVSGTVGYALNQSVSSPSVQTQSATYAATGGTAPNFTITLSPVPASLVNGLRASIYVSAAGTTGSNTLNVNGLGARNVYQMGSGGGVSAVVNGFMPINAQLDLEYNTALNTGAGGWMIKNPVPVFIGSGGRKNLVVTYSQSNATFTVTADQLLVEDSVGNQTRLVNVSLSIPAGTAASAGQSGYSSGIANSYASGNWYPIFISYNPSTGVLIGLVDLAYSTTNASNPATGGNQPTNPVTGYTQNCLVDAGRMKASSAPWYWYPRIVNNFDWSYTLGTYLTTSVMAASGNYSTAATVQVRGQGYPFPPWASKVKTQMYTPAVSAATQPSSAWGTTVNATTLAYMGYNATTGSADGTILYEQIMESNNFYMTSGAATIYCFAYGATNNF
jgi:hypothetical protein